MPQIIDTAGELPVSELPPETWTDMAHLVAAHARDPEDAEMLLHMLGVPAWAAVNALRAIRGQAALTPVTEREAQRAGMPRRRHGGRYL